MCQRWQELRIERGKVVMIKIAQVAPVLAPLMPQLEHFAYSERGQLSPTSSRCCVLERD